MPTSYDLQELRKFLDKPKWAACFKQVVERHFLEILEPAGMDFDDLRDALGEAATTTLWLCAFEDFLTQHFDITGQNVIDIYLNGRGREESAEAKAYLQALRASTMSLYEVSDVIPGTSLMVRDLIRGGRPVLVHESIATRSLKQWDKIAARVVRVMDQNVLTEGLLAYSDDAADLVRFGIRETAGKRGSAKKPTVTDAQLWDMAYLFTMVWLADTLDHLPDVPEPHVTNTDGDDLVLHTTSFPIAKGIRQKEVAERLDQVETLSRDGSKFWYWVEKPTTEPLQRPQGAETLDSMMDGGTRVFGEIELLGRWLLLSTNSAARAEKGTEMLEAALGDLVGIPVTTSEADEDPTAEDLWEPPASRGPNRRKT